MKAICIGLGELVGLLEKLSDDATMTHDTRSEACTDSVSSDFEI